ncbi:hypothetical protein, partial [Pseudomonas sp. GW456-11-11-14-TSB2]|uniref:hypothetical protein n=4 Tax=unclassified Pseudomonas TaxID=196821 RepID=UPI001A91AC78
TLNCLALFWIADLSLNRAYKSITLNRFPLPAQPASISPIFNHPLPCAAIDEHAPSLSEGTQSAAHQVPPVNDLNRAIQT